MMRKSLVRSAFALVALAAGTGSLHAQEVDGADALQWTWRLEGAGDDLTLVATAKVAEGYIVYGSDFKGAVGPRPSRIRFTDATSAQPSGALESVDARRRTDQTIGAEYSYFEHTAQFRQKLHRQEGASHVAGRLEGQACHETDGTCTLYRAPFDLPLSAAAAPRR